MRRRKQTTERNVFSILLMAVPRRTNREKHRKIYGACLHHNTVKMSYRCDIGSSFSAAPQVNSFLSLHEKVGESCAAHADFFIVYAAYTYIFACTKHIDEVNNTQPAPRARSKHNNSIARTLQRRASTTGKSSTPQLRRGVFFETCVKILEPTG